MALKLRMFQIGTPAKRGDGLRIGTTRRPPRGVPRDRWQADGYFDVWFPVVAPTLALFHRFRGRDLNDPAQLRAVLDAYEREVLKNTESRQAIHLLAELARRTPISIGCFCGDERRCHRSRLKLLIQRAATGKPL